MIFAAGFGTRLGEIGRRTPKALIDVGGRTMLERTVERLIAAGADRIVVNVHHHADRIEAFLAGRDFGAEILVSREPARPLETGGGLAHARALFRGTTPILLHNVDVISDADLGVLVGAHAAAGVLATLAVNERETSRHLLFDDRGLLGREDRRHGLRLEGRPASGPVRALAFAGIHVCSSQLLDLMMEHDGARGKGAVAPIPILDIYLRLVAEGHVIRPWLIDGRWFEIGSVERLETARAAMASREGG